MLTDTQIQKAKPTGKPYRITDRNERGLHVFVAADGRKYIRCRVYLPNGKDTTRGLGEFPYLKLKQAREMRDAMLRESKTGEGRFAPPPPPDRPTLRGIVRQWMDEKRRGWEAVPHEVKAQRVLDKHIFSFVPADAGPPLGDRPFDQITSKMLSEAFRQNVVPRSLDIAVRTNRRLVRAFDFAGNEYDHDDNPAERCGRNLDTYKAEGHRLAITDLAEARAMLRKLEGGPGRPTTKLAMRLLALTALRPSELVHGMWSELEGDTWKVPGQRPGKLKGMKLRRSHDVPLSRQALEALEALRELTGQSELMFWSFYQGGREPLNISTLAKMLRQGGYEGQHQPHGWRSTFSTNMNERRDQLPHDRAVVELMLAHKPPGVAGIYDRSAHMDRRRELAQEWADMLLNGFPSASEAVQP